MPNFVILAVLLLDWTKISQPWKIHLSYEYEEDFWVLREQLTQEPVLSHLDFIKPFVLQTDTLEVGLGTVLAKETDAEEHPILYLSCKLLPQETCYSREGGPGCQVGNRCPKILPLGNLFQLVTKHSPLRWTNSMKDTNAWIIRRYLLLQPYDFCVLHQPGKAQANAESLSRVGEKEEEGSQLDTL